jgi:hypothetical protein
MEVNACILITHMVYLTKTEFRLSTTFIPIIIIIYNWYLSSIQSLQYMHGHELQYAIIHGAFPLLLSPLASSPFLPLCTPFYFLGTLLAVTGIIHLSPRLLVN